VTKPEENPMFSKDLEGSNREKDDSREKADETGRSSDQDVGGGVRLGPGWALASVRISAGSSSPAAVPNPALQSTEHSSRSWLTCYVE